MPYERTAGTALATVQNWCRHLTNAGTFDTTTAPTLAQVIDFLAFGQADLMSMMVRYGYGTAAPTDPNGLAWLEKMNCLRAVIDIEMTYPVTEFGQPNPRMNMFVSQWSEGTAVLGSGQAVDLGLTGSEKNLSDDLVFTGTSASRMSSRESETDRVAGKFVRDFGQSYRAPRMGRTYSPNSLYDPNA